MAFHGLLIVTEFTPGRPPVAGLQRKKVTVQLKARPAVTRKLAAKPAIDRSGKKERLVPVLPEAVEVAVREIPAFVSPQMPAVPDLHKDVPVSNQEAADEPVEDSVDSPPSAIVMARPLYLDNPSPEYPALARRRQWQGTVIIKVHVSSEGKVMDLQVDKSSGREVLDEAALKSVSSWRFEPGRKGLRRVDMEVLVPVRFTIQ